MSTLRIGMPLVLLIILAGTSGLFSQTRDQNHYDFPQSIALELGCKGKTVSGYLLSATIEARVGEPRNLTVFFDSAPGWRVDPPTLQIAQIRTGEKETFKASLVTLSDSSRSGQPWVMMRVSFLPDYVALVKDVKDVRKFPDSSERSRLLGIIRRNFRDNALQKDGIRLDPNDSQNDLEDP